MLDTLTLNPPARIFCACPRLTPCAMCRATIAECAASETDHRLTTEAAIRRRHTRALEQRTLLTFAATWPEVQALLRTIEELRRGRE